MMRCGCGRCCGCSYVCGRGIGLLYVFGDIFGSQFAVAVPVRPFSPRVVRRLPAFFPPFSPRLLCLRYLDLSSTALQRLPDELSTGFEKCNDVPGYGCQGLDISNTLVKSLPASLLAMKDAPFELGGTAMCEKAASATSLPPNHNCTTRCSPNCPRVFQEDRTHFCSHAARGFATGCDSKACGYDESKCMKPYRPRYNPLLL